MPMHMSEAEPSSIDFSLVILCYRAGESIIPFVQRISDLLSWIDIRYEIILVANYWPNTADTTPQVIRNLVPKIPHSRAVIREKEGAMGWDLRSGLDVAQGKYVGFIDGDGQFPVDSLLPPLYGAIKYKSQLAKTYRVLRGDGLVRKLVSFCYNNLFRLLFHTDYNDINSKPKIIQRDFLRQMNLRSNDWFIDAEIMIRAKQMNLKVDEYPIHFVENAERASFIRFDAVIEFIKNLYRFRFNSGNGR